MAEPQEKSAYQKYREEREAARKAAKGQIETPPSAYSEYKSKREQERAGAPASGKQAALDARNAQIRERQDLTGKALKAVRDVQDIQRKRRVEPVERAAGEAGREVTMAQLGSMSPFVAGMGGGNAAQIAGQAASEQVYNEADVMSLPTAIDLRTINALAAGVPGIVNKDFRGKLAQAGEDQPGGALLGDIQGFLAPGMAAWDTAAAGVNALARPFIPRGADAASRTVRYGAPLAGQVTGAAAQNAAFQAGVQEPIRAETAGEDLTLAGMGEAAQRGATDPLNLLPVGLSAVNRTWNQLTSGIATPSARAADMANRFGVGPRQTAASQGIAQTTQQLGGQLQGADIRGLTNIENALRFALRDNRNIPDVNARIATGFQRIRESLPLEDDPTLNLARLIEREFAEDAPQTRDIIRNFLRGVGLNSPGGAQIVGDAANQLRGMQANALRTELEASFGAQPKIEANAAMQQSLDQFSAAYNTVLGAAPRQGPQVDRALALLAREPQSAAILDDIAQSQNLTAEQFIERNPLQALHVVQSELATQARALAARGDAGAGPLEITVRNMQRPLREAVPGYGDLQGLWRQWTQARERMGYVRGAESGTRGELSTVPGFGDKIFGPGGIAKSEMGTQTAADVFLQMDDLSQRAAGLSVRDVINDELRKGKAAGLEERYQTAANMRRVATEGGLDALRRVFGQAGDRVARRIEQFIDASEFARNIDPEFNSATMNKAQAMQTGAQPFAGPMGQATQSAAGSLGQNAVGDAFMMASGITTAPVLSAIRAVPWLANRLQPSQRTQRNIAQTLLRRGEIGSRVPPRPPGPAPITPIDPAMVPGAGPAPGGPPPSGPPPAPPAGGTPPQGGRTVGVAPAAGAPVPTPPPPPSPLAEWQQVMPQIRAARQVADDLREAAEAARSPDQIANVQTQLMLLRQQLQEVMTARGAGQTAEDLRLQEIIDALSVGGQNPRYLSALADGVANDLDAITQALNPVRTVGVPPTPIRGAGFALGPDASNALAGGTLGGIAPAESDEERLRNIAIGAGLGYVARPASQAVGRVSDRVLGSGSPNLKGVDKKRQAYTFDVGGAKAKVTFQESFPDDGDYPRRVPTDLARLREDVRQEYLTPLQALDRSVEAIVPDRYNRAALGPGGPTRTLQDYVNVEMDISNNNLTLPQAKQLFEKTFDTLEDHAIRYKRPVYYFTGAKPSQQTLYENSIKRRGAPKGYVATTGPDGFYFVRDDLFPNFAKELEDDGYDVITRTVGTPRTPSGRTVGQGGYFGRQSMRPPGSGPSAREIETQQQWATATPIVTQARTTAQSAQQAADAALQSKAPADIARAQDQKKALVGQLQEAQASRAGMDTPEDARLAETLTSLAENTSDPVLLSTQISAAKTSLDRLLTDIGSPVEGNLIPVRTNILTRTQAPRSAADGPQDRASVTRYAEGGDEVKPQGFFNRPPRQALGKGLQDIMNDAAPDRPKGAAPAPAEDFATAVNRIAAQVNTPPFSHKAAIADVHAAYVQQTGNQISLADFKQEVLKNSLGDSARVRLLPLDDPKAMSLELREASRIPNPAYKNLSFEFIDKRNAAPPIKPMGFGASTPTTPQQAARVGKPKASQSARTVGKAKTN